MARTRITIDTTQYANSHGHAPRQPRMQGRAMWAFILDADGDVVMTYGTYQEALTWAKALARTSVEVLP